MVLIERANPTDRLDVERLIAAYLTSEGVKPRTERITWAVEQGTAGTSSNVRGRPSGAHGTPPVRTLSRIRGSAPAGGCARDPGRSGRRGAGSSQTRSPPTLPWIRGTRSRPA